MTGNPEEAEVDKQASRVISELLWCIEAKKKMTDSL
jgi:hypothetical protein